MARDIRFVVVRYRRIGEAWVPDLPDRCPYADGEAGKCRISKDHERERLTGPGFPLWVCRCRLHRKGFGLYPSGYGPFLRVPMVAMTPEGYRENVVEEFSSSKEKAEPRLSPQRERFLPTQAGAAVDAARGRFWPSETQEGEGSTHPRYSTQVRRLRRLLRCLGKAPDLSETARLQISQLFGKPLVDSQEAASRGWATKNQALGEIACRILETLCEGWQGMAKLTHAAYLAGVWGLPSFWDARARVARTEPFRRPGTGGLTVS